MTDWIAFYLYAAGAVTCLAGMWLFGREGEQGE